MALFDLPETRMSKDKAKQLAKKSGNTTARVSAKGQNADDIKLSLIIQKIPINHPEYLIDNYADALKWVEELDEPILVIDTEGTGKVPLVDKTVGISAISLHKENGRYFPFGHVDREGNLLKNQLTKEEMFDIVNRINAKTRGIYHYGVYDIRILKDTLGLDYYPPIYWDTQVAACMLNEFEPHGLKALWNKYCNKKAEDKADKFGELFEDLNIAKVPPLVAAQYAVKDVVMTRDVYFFQEPYLDGQSEKCLSQDLVDCSSLYKDVELPLIHCVAAMEDTGIPLDQAYAQNLKAEYSQVLEKAEKKCVEEITTLMSSLDIPEDKKAKLGNPVNIASPVQLAIIIYDGLKLTSPDSSKPRGTGEEIIEKLADKHPALRSILEYRAMAKLMSTYINPIPEAVLEDGRVHTNFNQFGAKTGRFSSSDPVNMQNIPAKSEAGKKIRQMFIASPGYVLVGADYSQQEPRVLTQISQDKAMLKAYAEDKDIYAGIGAHVFGVPYEECLEFNADGSVNKEGKSRRKKMKVLILAKMYGNGDKSVAESLGVSLKEAKDIGKVFNQMIPGAEWAADYHRKMVHQLGYVKTVYGRKRRLPGAQLPEYEIFRENERVTEEEYAYFISLLDNAWGREKQKLIKEIASNYGLKIVDNGGKIADAERQAMNAPIQGTAADMTKKAMLGLYQSKKLQELGYRLLFPVHDEIIGECPEENWPEVVKEKERIMTTCCSDRISVPMKVDIEVSKVWTGKSLI